MASFFVSPPFLSHPITRINISSSSQSPTPQPPNVPPQPQIPPPTQQQLSANSAESQRPNKAASARTNAESTDWIASTITRRFGIGAGLAWVGFFAVGVVSETNQDSLRSFSTRGVGKEEEVVLPNGIRYYDLRVGGGATPRARDLVVVNVKGCIQGNGQVFVDTFGGEKKRALALVLGSRPYSKGVCEGIEYVLRNMKAGGKRKVIIPPTHGFGEEGADLGEGVVIPPFATLECVVQVDRVSIAPA